MNLWPDVNSIYGVSDHQRERLALCTAGPVGILLGGPGTGKTYSAAALLKAVSREHGPGNIAVAAPTGKAAVRITAAMQQAGMHLAHDATTIHRLLAVSRNGHDKKGWGFQYHAGNPLPWRFIAIDEVSMLDLDLASSLFAACQPGTHILLIGDPGQLPPVGHGAPLRDMIAAGVPCGELTEIHRNQGDIVRACQAIRAGRVFQASRTINIAGGSNLLHLPTMNASDSWRRLERLLSTCPGDIDRVWDVQIMVAVNEKSELSRVELNKRLQGLLNPGGEQVKGNRFRVGDKVICLNNSWLPLLDEQGNDQRVEGDGGDGDGHGELLKDFVANGEIGKVIAIEKNKMVVKFDAPARMIRVAGDLLGDWDLAYAITVHKSQGSQWPVAIYVSDDYAGARHVASRELLYTALSRAERLAVTIGKFATICHDCRKEALSRRKTFLKELLTGDAA